MRKTLIVLALLLVCILLTGCSAGSSSPIKREHESKDDVIKFYNFDWMTGIEEIKQGLIKEHGEESFRINYPRVFSQYSDTAGVFLFGIYGTNEEKQLLWELADQKIDHMVFKLVSDPSVSAKKASYDQMYLYGGTYYFVDVSSETAKALKSKLNKIYGSGERDNNSSAEINFTWTDANNNRIKLYYNGAQHYKIGDTWYDDDPMLYLEYTCDDIDQYLQEESDKNKEQQKQQDAGDDKL